MYIYLSGEWNTPGESKQVALKCFFRVDQESLPQVEVSFYELNYVYLRIRMLYFFFLLLFYLQKEKGQKYFKKQIQLFQANPNFATSFTI